MNTQKFQVEYEMTVLTLIHLAETSRREGLLAIESEINANEIPNRDLMNTGLQFVVDGTDADMIRKWYDLAIESSIPKADYLDLIIAKVIKEGVLMIQEGMNPRCMIYMLDAMCPIELRPQKIKDMITTDTHRSDEEDD